VPLIGTKGCVNYNPILAQKQFGYPIRGSPTPDALTTLLISYEDGGANEVLRDIRNAWRNVICMERDSRAWAVNREISYRQWITERVKKVKLSFEQISSCLTNEEQMQNEELEEVKKLKEEVAKLKEKNVKMADDLLGLQHSYADLNREYEEKTKAYEGLIKKQRTERDYTHKIKQDLSAANKELKMRVQERNTALLAERQWKNLY